MTAFEDLKQRARSLIVMLDESETRRDADGKPLAADAPTTGDELVGFSVELELRPVPEDIRAHPDFEEAFKAVLQETFSASRQIVNNYRWAKGQEEFKPQPVTAITIQVLADLPEDVRQEIIAAMRKAQP